MDALARRIAEVKETGEPLVLPRGGDKRSDEASSTRNLQNDATQDTRAKEAGISKRQQECLDALARKAPEKLAEVQAGEKSVHRACVEAGIVKVPTVLDQVKRLLPKLTAGELAEARLLLPLHDQE